MDIHMILVAVMVSVLSVSWIPAAFVAAIRIVDKDRAQRLIEYRARMGEVVWIMAGGMLISFVVSMLIFMARGR